MKKRSNIALIIILLLLFSIPVAGYGYFHHLMKVTEKTELDNGQNPIRLKATDKDSIQVSFSSDKKQGFEVKTQVIKHSK